ncbi:hypothetical protein RIF23_20045 [Lipingzhangella sp. LS1_29]|uniref:MFS transporter n=1 Tax=Lipingzhangella rawalii TaxID=2055835 RepID=A0ABU2HDE4_9ACTN|nr:hypothetical protein [Lipingzhangella rawalii]MDS1272584.1 hypothetical protein [Lipingzhangella rawalii]
MATSPDTTLLLIIAGISVVGLGHGVAMALVVDLIVSSAPAEKTGSAAAAQEVGGELGTALGIAAGGAVGMTVYRASLSASMPAGVSDTAATSALNSVHEGIATAQELSAGGPELLTAVHHAVAAGLQTYAAIGAALVGLAVVLVTIVLVRRDDAQGPHEEEGDTPTPVDTPS